MSDKLREFIEIPQQFVQDGNQFLTRCTKPSQKEFVQICKAVAVGFAVMGFIGYFVKLIHIPINNILVYVFFLTWNCSCTLIYYIGYIVVSIILLRKHKRVNELLCAPSRPGDSQTSSSSDTVTLSIDKGRLSDLVLNPLTKAVLGTPTDGIGGKFAPEVTM
ncbi:SecE/Sec61-gamma subunits of protein translocation complex [Lentinula detonsa]|uniref:SecE/Sec61-gamma subunits of protein translocation complex n=1 Tax=Lentinula detonsa TaxID=2804962 RepID=A0A9W8PBI0_9AGAR|nr:SecE/Sec61-gamma subunits of protein translocation complex [Lentinula detonsa]